MDVGRGILVRIAIEFVFQGKIFFFYYFVGYISKSLDRFIYSIGINFFFLYFKFSKIKKNVLVYGIFDIFYVSYLIFGYFRF